MFSVHNSWIPSYDIQHKLNYSPFSQTMYLGGVNLLSINQFPSTFLIIYLIYFDYVATFHFVLVHEYTVYIIDKEM